MKKANTDVGERSGMYVDSDAWLGGEFDSNDETVVEVRATECDVSIEAAADFVAADDRAKINKVNQSNSDS